MTASRYVEFLKLQAEPRLLTCQADSGRSLPHPLRIAWWGESLTYSVTQLTDPSDHSPFLPSMGTWLQHSQANKDVVHKSKTVLHDVDHGIGEDTDVSTQESSQAVQP